MTIHREGRGILLKIAAILLLINVPTYLYANQVASYTVATLSALFFLLTVSFFRSPARSYEGEVEGCVIAPADGKIVAIEEVMEPAYFGEKRIQVSIFMTVFNVHANWYPVEGEVTHASHQCGRYMGAYLPKSSTENERSTVAIRTPQGTEVMMRQVAGALARRIVTYAKQGCKSCINQHMGFIKFGSRIDLYLPLDAEILVKLNDKTVGNQSLIARLK